MPQETKAELEKPEFAWALLDQITAVPALPHTRTGKKPEVPIKRILQGAAPADVLSIAAVDDPSRWRV